MALPHHPDCDNLSSIRNNYTNKTKKGKIGAEKNIHEWDLQILAVSSTIYRLI